MALKRVFGNDLAAILQKLLHTQGNEPPVAAQAGGVQRQIEVLIRGRRRRLGGCQEGDLDLLWLIGEIAYRECCL